VLARFLIIPSRCEIRLNSLVLVTEFVDPVFLDLLLSLFVNMHV